MYKTILVAIDVNDADSARLTSATARDLAALTGAGLHVVNVIPDSGMAIVDAALGEEEKTHIRKLAQDALTDFARSELPEISDANLHVVEGTIYDRILQTADRIEADLIVVGTHRPELGDYLVGPNASRVARHARQSVLVAR